MYGKFLYLGETTSQSQNLQVEKKKMKKFLTRN